jgi:single-stranded-DNA-specific exonuclease
MEPVAQRLWQARVSGPTTDPINLADELGVTVLTARVLAQRGIATVADAEQFLRSRLATLPDPFLLRGMEAGVSRLVTALESGETIAIHGDYDVDGISATALLVEFLHSIGGTVSYHIPLRLKDGYGLSAEALEQAAASGVRVVVSVDCGVSAHAEADLARRLGLDLIITDHHQPPQRLPSACALINPHQPDCPFPDKRLAGVGVAFFLLIALRGRLREQGYFTDRSEPDLRHALDLVALGTIADMVPLTGLNRLLTRVGLQVIAGSRPGLRALRAVAGVDEVDCSAVGFRLAPRLNAAGRIEDAALGVELLLTADQGEAEAIATRLDVCNRERQELEQRTLIEASALVAELPESVHSIVLASSDWHPGVIGIVASRLVERFYRPTILLSVENGTARGSARSTRDVHLYQALSACSPVLTGFGGHAAAAGMTLSAADIDALRTAFDQAVQSQMAEVQQPLLEHDGEVLLEELDAATVEELAELAPFGIGNAAPLFRVCQVRAMGVQSLGGSHLRFTARQDAYSLPCIAFGFAPRRAELATCVDLLVTPEINIWKGRRSVQLRVRDWQPTTVEG